MVLSARVARWNRNGLNKVTRRIAPHVAGFGLLLHTGRRSRRAYSTPVNVFTRPGGGLLVCLTYGSGTDWVKNVLAAGGCRVISRDRERRYVHPRLIRDSGLAASEGLPAVVRFVLTRLHVDEFLILDPAPVEPPGDDGQERPNRSKNSSASTTS